MIHGEIAYPVSLFKRIKSAYLMIHWKSYFLWTHAEESTHNELEASRALSPEIIVDGYQDISLFLIHRLFFVAGVN